MHASYASALLALAGAASAIPAKQPQDSSSSYSIIEPVTSGDFSEISSYALPTIPTPLSAPITEPTEPASRTKKHPGSDKPTHTKNPGQDPTRTKNPNGPGSTHPPPTANPHPSSCPGQDHKFNEAHKEILSLLREIKQDVRGPPSISRPTPIGPETMSLPGKPSISRPTPIGPETMTLPGKPKGTETGKGPKETKTPKKHSEGPGGMSTRGMTEMSVTGEPTGYPTEMPVPSEGPKANSAVEETY